MNKVQLINIEKNYNLHKNPTNKEEGFTLHIPELTIEEGEFFGLLGPSGCGKSTILKLIAGLLQVDKGNIYIDNKDISAISTEKRNIGMVFQEPLLFPHMTIKENVAFGLKMRRINSSHREEKVSKILEIVGLKRFEKRYPHQLSGGQQQRGAIARALVCKPKILLMDEPFSALDPKLREEMREFIKELHMKYKTTIIFVTHDKEEAFLLFNRMAIMKGGEIVQIGSPKELYQKPKNPFVGRFLGIKNIFCGEIKEQFFYGEDFKLYIGEKSKNNLHNAVLKGYLIIRPEGCVVNKELNKKCGHNKYFYENYGYINGEVKNISFVQGFWHLEVRVSSKCSLHIVQAYEENIGFFLGDKVVVGYNLNKISIIEQ